MIENEIRNIASECSSHCREQETAKSVIEERMEQMAEEMVSDAMRSILKLAARESYESVTF
jgi:CRISPR/Cas system-associated endonuclease Cas1